MQTRSDISKVNKTAILLLMICNPTSVSSFALWFGAFGLFSWYFLPFVPVVFTLPIAVVAGFIGARLTLGLMSMVMSHMFASTSFRQENLIGLKAEVTVGIQDGRLGEITTAAGGRYTYSAKAQNPTDSFKRGQEVIICDLQDDVAFVEIWPDSP